MVSFEVVMVESAWLAQDPISSDRVSDASTLNKNNGKSVNDEI